MMLDRVDNIRRKAGAELDSVKRAELGQFFTSKATAYRMASMFRFVPEKIRLLDPGAGTGMLFSAFVAVAFTRFPSPKQIILKGYEIDRKLRRHWRLALDECEALAGGQGGSMSSHILMGDFIKHGASEIAKSGGLEGSYTHAILNPPYRKLKASSPARQLLNGMGLSISNLYSAFLILASMLLSKDGELVAIVPRSFCNGPHFRAFREQFLRLMSIEQIHLFDSRTAVFSEDSVLQENLIVHARRGAQSPYVTISSSADCAQPDYFRERVPVSEILHPEDIERFIHVQVVKSPGSSFPSPEVLGLTYSLDDLGIAVSTGRVVDFRVDPRCLRKGRAKAVQPLIYPHNLVNGAVRWPIMGKKPNGLIDCPATRGLWMPSGVYTVVKRFSAKEARRRIVATSVDTASIPCSKVAFENHLNVFHCGGSGLEGDLSAGLTCFLNSQIVDLFFRGFSGHTQVNATDLRSLRYPSIESLCALGRAASLTDGELVTDELLNHLRMYRGQEKARRPKSVDVRLPAAALNKSRSSAELQTIRT